jgi:hypothetical protein
MSKEFSASLEDLSRGSMRPDWSILEVRDEPRVQSSAHFSSRVVGQLFYLFCGVVLPVVGVLWLMTSYP